MATSASSRTWQRHVALGHVALGAQIALVPLLAVALQWSSATAAVASSPRSAGKRGSLVRTGAPSRARPAQAAASAPHVMVLMMENRSISDIVGNSSTPYETKLSRTYETATNSYGVGHYSLDNYLAALSGHFYGWATSDCTPGPSCHATDPTLAGQLDHAKIPWRAYMGSMPSRCDAQNYDQGTVGHSYGVRHDPFVYFPALMKTDCAKVVPSTDLIGNLNASSPPDFVWYSPQICHDGGGDESCATRANGDAFLSKAIPRIQSTKWYRHGGVIVLTYDEGNGSGQGRGEYLQGSGNHVLSVVISKATYHHAAYRRYVNQFGLLAGIERAYGLPCLAKACAASNGTFPIPSRPVPAQGALRTHSKRRIRDRRTTA